MNYDVYPILKDQYVDKGVITDVDSVRSVLASIFTGGMVSIECDGMYIQIAIENWVSQEDDMKQLLASFPLLSFQVELVPDGTDECINKWEY